MLCAEVKKHGRLVEDFILPSLVAAENFKGLVLTNLVHAGISGLGFRVSGLRVWISWNVRDL